MEQAKLQKMDLTHCQQAIITLGRGAGMIHWRQNSLMLQAHKNEFSSHISRNWIEKLSDFFFFLCIPIYESTCYQIAELRNVSSCLLSGR